MLERSFISFDGVKLSCCLWDKVNDAKGVLLIVHGMAEHALRYSEFAEFMNKSGYIVFVPNLRAHGATAEEGKLGVAMDDIFGKTVEDVIQLSGYLSAKYKLPIIVLGHSYGSFATQAVIERYHNLAGVILSGSACLKGLKITFAKSLAAMQAKIMGAEVPAKFINKLTFSAYDSEFKEENKEFAWLTRDDEIRKKYVEDPECGYIMSSGFQASFFAGVSDLYKTKSLKNIEKQLPIAILCGAADPVGGMGKLSGKLYQTYINTGLTNVKLKIYPKARHEILNETNRAEVYADILEFADSIVANRI